WVLAEEADRSRIMGQDAQQDPDRRRLAGAVGAEEAVDLAAGDLEIEPVESADSAIGLHDLAHRDRRRGGCASLVCAGAGQRSRGSSSPGGGSSVSPGGWVSVSLWRLRSGSCGWCLRIVPVVSVVPRLVCSCLSSIGGAISAYARVAVCRRA